MTADEHPPPFRRLLEIGRDPLLKLVWPQHTTYLPTGAPLRPGPPPAYEHATWSEVRRGLRHGDYDALVLPAIHADWTHDATLRRRWGRRLLTASIRVPGFAPAIMRWYGAQRRPVAVLDVVDHSRVSATSRAFYPAHAHYFKTNLLASDASVEPERLHYLPMALDPALYPDGLATEKTADILWATAPNSPARAAVAAAVPTLAAAGLRIDQPTTRLDHAEFVRRMSQAWITLSPAGFGHQCWRHYEALLAGSLPLISPAPQPQVETLDLDFLADTPAGLLAQVQSLLAEPEILRARIAHDRACVREHHSLSAVASRLVSSLRQQYEDLTPAPGGEHTQ